jgi:hypothetical protein
MAVCGRYYLTHVPVIDARIAEEMITRGDRGAVPLLRARIDELYSSELLGYWRFGGSPVGRSHRQRCAGGAGCHAVISGSMHVVCCSVASYS